MAAEPGTIIFRLESDPRLTVGVAAAVAHIARLAGLTDSQQSELAGAVEDACRDTLPLLTSPRAALGVTIRAFPDRVEILLEHQGQTLLTAGLDTFAVPGAEQTGAGSLSGLHLLARVDRVQYETQGGVSRTRLVKHFRKPSAK